MQADICDGQVVQQILARYWPDAIMHLAAESHVDRSIEDPLAFAKTNILGTMNLLNSFKNLWDKIDVATSEESTQQKEIICEETVEICSWRN